MAGFAGHMAELAVFPDTVMGRPWTWRAGGEELEVRDAFHRILEAELAQISVSAPSRQDTFPSASTEHADRALGDLLGLLAGQPDELLDMSPGPGDWDLREVLHHVLKVELSFASMVRWARRRAPDEPLAPPDEQRQRESAAPASGSVVEIMERLVAARDATAESVSEVRAGELRLPTVWAGHEVDIAFRLHRFAAHLTEHGIQVEKVLRSLDRDPAEARQMVRAIWAARSAHQRGSSPSSLEALDRAIADRLPGIREAAYS